MRDPTLWGLPPLGASNIPNQTLRKHQETATSRFRLYQYLASQDIAPNIMNVPTKFEEAEAKKLLSEEFKNADLPATSPDGTVIAKTRADLIKLVFALKTKKHSQRALGWDRPSPTVVTLPDDYIHPHEPRIFTVRELARFQGFPDDFEFRSKETTGGKKRKTEVPQYSQVGNAVAPLMGYAVGKRIRSILEA